MAGRKPISNELKVLKGTDQALPDEEGSSIPKNY